MSEKVFGFFYIGFLTMMVLTLINGFGEFE